MVFALCGSAGSNSENSLYTYFEFSIYMAHGRWLDSQIPQKTIHFFKVNSSRVNRKRNAVCRCVIQTHMPVASS